MIKCEIQAVYAAKPTDTKSLGGVVFAYEPSPMLPVRFVRDYKTDKLDSEGKPIWAEQVIGEVEGARVVRGVRGRIWKDKTGKPYLQVEGVANVPFEVRQEICRRAVAELETRSMQSA